MTEAIGMKGRGPGVVRIADHKLIRAYGDPKLIEAISNPIKFVGKNPKGSSETSDGFEADVLAGARGHPDRSAIKACSPPSKTHRYAQYADAPMRGFARVGLVALIDEATGYQNDRNRDELAKILEAFVTRELRPWVPTFPPEFYERLYKPQPPLATRKGERAPWFSRHITNNVVYDRLAPPLLPELKAAASKAEKRAGLHQFLTEDIGHPALRAHLALHRHVTTNCQTSGPILRTGRPSVPEVRQHGPTELCRGPVETTLTARNSWLATSHQLVLTARKPA